MVERQQGDFDSASLEGLLSESHEHGSNTEGSLTHCRKEVHVLLSTCAIMFPAFIPLTLHGSMKGLAVLLVVGRGLWACNRHIQSNLLLVEVDNTIWTLSFFVLLTWFGDEAGGSIGEVNVHLTAVSLIFTHNVVVGGHSLKAFEIRTDGKVVRREGAGPGG